MSPMWFGVLLAAAIFGSLFIFNLLKSKQRAASLQEVLDDASFTIIDVVGEEHIALARPITPSVVSGRITMFAERDFGDGVDRVYRFKAPQHERNSDLHTNTVGTVFMTTGTDELPRLRVARKGAAARLVTEGGLQRVRTGDAVFDSDWAVWAESEDIARAWLTAELRDWFDDDPLRAVWTVEPGMIAVQPLSMPDDESTQRALLHRPSALLELLAQRTVVRD